MLTFLLTRSSLVSPGFLGTPAVITTISASLASEYSPGWMLVSPTNGVISSRSIESPTGRSLATSQITNSSKSTCCNKSFAKVEPTAPSPTSNTFLLIISPFIKITCSSLHKLLYNKRFQFFNILKKQIIFYKFKVVHLPYLVNYISSLT